MSKSVINKTLDLLGSGYAPYDGEIEVGVYERLKCRKESQARWFVKLTECNMYVVCLGCSKGCSLVNPKGFQAVLPMKGGMVPVVAGVVPVISDEQLLRSKKLLRLGEVMALCRVEERKARSLIENGELEVLEGLPIRVTTRSVVEYMNRTRD